MNLSSKLTVSAHDSPQAYWCGKIAAAPRAPRPTGILPIHACMINSDNEISDSEIISTGIPYTAVLIYRYSLAVQLYSPVRALHGGAVRAQHATGANHHNVHAGTLMWSLMSLISALASLTLGASAKIRMIGSVFEGRI